MKLDLCGRSKQAFSFIYHAMEREPNPSFASSWTRNIANRINISLGTTTLQGESSQKFEVASAGIKSNESRAIKSEIRLGCVVEDTIL